MRKVMLAMGAALALTAGWLTSRLTAPHTVSLGACTVPGGPIVLAHGRNSLATASAALEHGFCGLEMDVQWREGVGLVLAHDPLPAGWQKAGSTTAAGVLDSMPRLPGLLWLDFKNLSPANAASAASHLDSVVARHGLRGRVIVESRRWRALSTLHRRLGTVIPAYWIPPRPSGVRGAAYDAKLTLILALSALPALSVPKRILNAAFVSRFRRFTLFTWTFTTPDEIRFASRMGARIILTDAESPSVASGRQTSP